MSKEVLTRLYWRGVEAVMPGPLVRNFLSAWEWSGPVKILAVGKAAGSMAHGAWEAWGDKVDEALVILPSGMGCSVPWRKMEGGHPVPSEGSLEAGEAALDLVRRTGEEELLLVLLSGGASSLMEVPWPGLTLEDLVGVGGLLLKSGATIREVNAVRKHLSAVKGGRLAREAWPAKVAVLVLSDVVGDPLDVVGSGPFHPDATTFAYALDVLERRGLLSSLPVRVVDHLRKGVAGEIPETPKGEEPWWSRVEHHILGNNRRALEAMARGAEEEGMEAVIYTSRMKGEAREVAQVVAGVAWEKARDKERPSLLLWGGEATVTVKGDGQGGRAQEMALALAVDLEGWPGTYLVAGTDGIDGTTSAAGAFGDGTTVARAAQRGLVPLAYLDNNDSYTFFEALGDLFITGPTGTNVMDVALFYLP